MACFWPDRVDPSTGDYSLSAVDEGGWALRVEGETFWPNTTFKLLQGSPMTYAVASPSRLRATKIAFEGKSLDYIVIRFAMVNLLFGRFTTRIPSPVTLDIGNWQVTIKPVEAYQELSASLRGASGFEHTAFIELRRDRGERQSLDDAVSFLSDLVPALRLWSGNKLDWLYGEGPDDDGSIPIERLHKHSIVGNFSNSLSGRGWEINLEEFVKSYFSGKQLLDRNTIRELIDYFADACATGPFLEVRALSLATLLDAFTLKLARSLGSHEVMPESEFKHEVLPTLDTAIEGTALGKEVKQQLRNNVSGIFRTSFRRRFSLLSRHLKLDTDNAFRNRVLRTRDSLVHEGRFPDEDQGDLNTAFERLLWTDAAALWRICGHEGDLPTKP